MKKLYLIRHAKSSWSDPTVSDFYRKLNKRGKRDAPFMALKLADAGADPDLIVSSPAKRARRTARYMAQGVGYPEKKIHYVEAIYSSATEDLYRVLCCIDNDCKEVFFVGHNYGITDLAEELTGEELVNIPTSGIVAMKCDISSWSKIEAGCGKMMFFDYPKKYPEGHSG